MQSYFDILNYYNEATFPDIIGYEIVDNDSTCNLRMYVNTNSVAVLLQLSKIACTYDEYQRTHRHMLIVDPQNSDNLIPYNYKDGYILFTGVKNSEGKWIRRSSPKTQIAYVKCYFLLEFFKTYLVDMNCDLYTEDICKTLNIDKEILSKILWRLYQDHLVITNTQAHKDSVNKYLKSSIYNRFVPYDYGIENSISASGYILNPDKSIKHIKPFNNIYYREGSYRLCHVTASPPAYLSGAGGSPETNTKEFPQTYTIIDFKLTHYLYTLVFLYDRNLSLDSAIPYLSSIIIPRFKHIQYNDADKGIINEDDIEGNIQTMVDDIHYEYLPFTPYIAPYEELTLNVGCREIFRVGKYDSIRLWNDYHSRTAKITICGRLWHPFHSLGREYRKFVSYNGSLLIEGMDISSCIYTLFYKYLRIAPNINPDELVRYYMIVRDGKFYEDVMRYVPDNFYTDELKLSGSKRNNVKTRLQAYRNTRSMKKASYLYPEIDLYFSMLFPSIRNFLFRIGTIRNRKGELVKRLQSDMCRIETFIISEVCYELVKYGLTPFSLHDGIYISENDMSKIGSLLGIVDTNEIQGWIGTLFWKKYEEIPDSKIRELIEWEIS